MTRYSAPIRKLFSDATIGARQIRAIASDGTPDRDGDIMDPAGADLSAYRSNPIVLANHNPNAPIGTAAVTRTPSAIEALITFAPLGASRTADEFCALAKAGVLSALSVGFRPTQPPSSRGNGGGVLWKAWELLEMSLVSVPANPSAVVLERAFAKDGRVLAAQHADSLERAHKRLTGARDDVAGVLAAAGRMAADDGDPEDDVDEELAYEIARRKRARRESALMRGVSAIDHEVEHRKRVLVLAQMRFGPLSSAEAAAVERARVVERLRRGS